jgi:uncharacterized membrane protein YraQ (UPF0718 family)
VHEIKISSLTTGKMKKTKSIDTSLIVLGVLIIAAIITAYVKGGWDLTSSGFMKSGHLLSIVWLRILLGFILAGFIQAVIPGDLVKKWIGSSSGIKGILIGSYGAIIATGSPYMWLPIVVSLYRAGAGVGPVLALVTARGVLSIQLLLVWQIPFFGAELAFSRYIPCLLVPPVVGLIGEYLFRLFGWSTQAGEEETVISEGISSKGVSQEA